MSTLLYIEASPRKKRSASIQVATTFIEEYKVTHPNDTVKTIDLWDKALPEFNGDVIESKYAIMHSKALTEAQRKAWKAVEEIIDEFKDADKYLFSLPMWNFGIPYKLKHYIDLIVQPTYLFNVTPSEGYKGLIVNKPVTLIYASGGEYKIGTGAEVFDFQRKYMDTILKFIGFTDIRSIIIEPTQPAEAKEKVVAAGKEKAIQMAKVFN